MEEIEALKEEVENEKYRRSQVHWRAELFFCSISFEKLASFVHFRLNRKFCKKLKNMQNLPIKHRSTRRGREPAREADPGDRDGEEAVRPPVDTSSWAADEVPL